MLSVKLVVIGGESKTKEVTLRLPTIIGRGREGVSLTLPHALVSRKHTEIFEEDGQLYVKDLGSLNGTFVNSQRISDKTLLQPNELLTLGNVTFRAMYDVETPDPVVVDSTPAESVEVVSVDVLNEEQAKSDGSDTDKSIVIAEVEVAPVEADKEETAEAFPISEPAVAIAKDADPGVVFSPERRDGESRKVPVSIRGIEGLPAGNQQGVDFALNLEGTAKPDSVKEVSIDLDETVPAPVAGDSRLGSFLKKMPR